MTRNNPNSSTPVKTAHVLLLFSLLAAQTLAQAPSPSLNAATNNPTAAINAAPTNVAITATNLDARRKALLRGITNRAPRLKTNATVLPALQAPIAATNIIVAAPGTNVNAAANVAAQAKAGDPLYSEDLGDQTGGIVVNAEASPDGGYDLLAVVQTASREGSTVHLKSLGGPVLRFLPLPYAPG